MLVSSGPDSSVTRVVVEKESVGSDGGFLFNADSTIEYGDPAQWPVDTVNGQGNKVVTLYFALDNELTVSEVPAPQWREEVVCFNDVTQLQKTGDASITLEDVFGEQFTSWQCTFTNTLLVDSDGDGVPDDDDKCPGQGIIGELGCQKVIGIPGLGTVYLNDESQSTVDSGQPGEMCSDCLIELEDNTDHVCFGAGDLTITGPETVSSLNCNYEAPALQIDGTGATITSTVNDSASCEGASGDCNVTADNQILDGPCTEDSCVRFYSRTALDGGSPDITRVVVSKTTVGDDGMFDFLATTNGFISDFPWSVTTTNGVGDKVVEVFFGDPSITVSETELPGWSESVSCVNTTTGDIIGGAAAAAARIRARSVTDLTPVNAAPIRRRDTKPTGAAAAAS